jgi:hypothetical protein
MGRPSKLTPAQWEAIGIKRLTGASDRALAAEYGVAPSTIAERFSERHRAIKGLAAQAMAVEQGIATLPISEQVAFQKILNELLAVSMHLAGAAKFGAATAHRLAGIAHGKALEIDDAAPLGAKSVESLKGIATLTRVANDAAATGLGLLAANKARMDEKPESDDTSDDARREALARRLEQGGAG